MIPLKVSDIWWYASCPSTNNCLNKIATMAEYTRSSNWHFLFIVLLVSSAILDGVSTDILAISFTRFRRLFHLFWDVFLSFSLSCEEESPCSTGVDSLNSECAILSIQSLILLRSSLYSTSKVLTKKPINFSFGLALHVLRRISKPSLRSVEDKQVKK